MSEQILAAIGAEERDILAPHIERLHAADRELREAKRVLILAASRLYPVLREVGASFDSERGVVLREVAEEVEDAA